MTAILETTGPILGKLNRHSTKSHPSKPGRTEHNYSLLERASPCNARCTWHIQDIPASAVLPVSLLTEAAGVGRESHKGPIYPIKHIVMRCQAVCLTEEPSSQYVVFFVLLVVDCPIRNSSVYQQRKGDQQHGCHSTPVQSR